MAYSRTTETAAVLQPLSKMRMLPGDIGSSTFSRNLRSHDRTDFPQSEQQLWQRAELLVHGPKVAKAVADVGYYGTPVFGTLLAITVPIIFLPNNTVIERIGAGISGMLLTCVITIICLALSVRQALTIARSRTTGSRNQLDGVAEAGNAYVSDCLSTYTVGVRADAIGSIDVVNSLLRSVIRQKCSCLMTFVNPASAVLAARNPAFRKALTQFDLVAPDGIGMVMAMQALHKQPAQRISFDSTSLAPLVFRLAVEHGVSVVLVGGAVGVAEAAKQRLLMAYPGLDIRHTFDGYADTDTTIRTIIALAPQIVIVGMGAPLQENFLLKLSTNGWSGLGFTCGGFLDQLALKGIAYYPAWIDRYNVRCLYRLVMEPDRLGRRYLIDYPKFGLLFSIALLRGSVGMVGRLNQTENVVESKL